jgi:NAD-dependent SIR2 family protein deacetylase
VVTDLAVTSLDAVRELLRGGDVVVLSGAGLSTESGIPDYRGPSGAMRTRAPMTYQSFVADPVARHRYWARSYLGWRQIDRARPNDGHRAVAALQAAGRLRGIITQNVDGLHQAAGATAVVELHGGLDRTICLGCGGREERADLDARLRAANPEFAALVDTINPDGDVELPEHELAGFQMVGCLGCADELLKPDVVFFGENVPRERVEHCYELVHSARALLVLGSSLTVMSGLRFVRRAAQRDIPVAIINHGATRGDPLARIRVDAPLGAALSELHRSLLDS